MICTRAATPAFSLICSLILLLAGAFQTNLRAESPSAIKLTLDTQHPGATIAANFTGLSFEVSQLLPNTNGVHYFRPDNQPLLQLFRTLGIKSLRIGGNTSDRDVRRLPELADIDSLFAFAKAADVKVIYCLRLHNGDPQADVQTAKYIMDRYANQLDCFSIGQEPSAYPVEKQDNRPTTERMGATNEKYQFSDYAADWQRFAAALIAAVPNVKFCGPSVHNNGDWAKKFIAAAGTTNHVALITEHLYPGGAGGKVPTPEIGRDRMLAGPEVSNSFVRVYQRLYDSFVPVAVSNNLPYRLEEVNNYFNGGAANVSPTFTSALWGADFMYWWAAHGAAGLNFHTGDKVAAGYTLQASKYTAYFTATNGYNVRPLGYGIKLFGLGSHGRFVPVTVSNPSNLNLTSYAVLGDDHNLYVTLINKEHGAGAPDAEVKLSANNSFGAAKMISLQAPAGDIAATTGETLGGQPIGNDGTWDGIWTDLPAGDWTVKVPAASAMVVMYRPE